MKLEIRIQELESVKDNEVTINAIKAFTWKNISQKFLNENLFYCVNKANM